MVGTARGWACPPIWLGFVLIFALWWPLGLVALALYFGSRAMCGWGHHRHGGWDRWQERREQWRAERERWRAAHRPSGNLAFDAYRDETLKRLEDDQRDFQAFLERLRRAKDQAQFDEFLADRERQRGEGRRPDNPGA
jgi:Protein of unknown function (DUF2852)